MKYLVMITVLILTIVNGYGQIIKDTSRPSMIWNITLVDAPFMKDAAQAEANRSQNGFTEFPQKIKLKNYANFYKNMSMEQITDMTVDLHGSSYYLNNLLWYKIIKPESSKRYWLNRLVANISSLGFDYLLLKLPYGYAYQHEEFHRAIMNARHISSHDEVWNFKKGLDIAVTNVKDEDLMYLKKYFPSDQVRLASAGVEGELKYFERLRKENFYSQANFPFVGLIILGTLHTVNYTKLPLTSKFDAITDSILSHDKNNILARDFTGYDFSAWVYDLFTRTEPYQERGLWPGGIGIKRPIKQSELTNGMKDFLNETANMQYLNLISPFNIGINKIKLKENLSFNFALQSIPTSFGYYSGSQFYIETNNKKWMIDLGFNKSIKTLPSIGFACLDHTMKKYPNFTADLKVNIWLQPKDQQYFSKSAIPGAFIRIIPTYKINRNIKVYAHVEYKTKGWVFGNPYLDNNFSFRTGLKINTNNRLKKG